MVDGKQKIADLSGGQKARFQIIKMLANKPNLLILDEPTNHLDLPSIEELEKALTNFEGGILYISHDTYFINTLGGTTVEL
jgi:ATPase subunit of ABC transporter with duplicated ATPase domains